MFDYGDVVLVRGVVGPQGVDASRVETIILHWYSGAAKHFERALDAGMCFSVNPAMLRSPTGLRVLSAVPPERILVESDGPSGQRQPPVSGEVAAQPE